MTADESQIFQNRMVGMSGHLHVTVKARRQENWAGCRADLVEELKCFIFFVTLPEDFTLI